MTCTFDRWVSIWGDPLLPATIIMAGYAIAAWLTWRVTQQETGRERLFWGLGTTLMLFLFLNTHLDLHILPGAFGRCLARLQGWWENRRIVQTIFVACVTGLMALMLLTVVIFFYRNLLRNFLFVLGCLVSAGYLIIKSSGLHYVDQLSSVTLGTVQISIIAEVFGSILISTSALIKLSDIRRAEAGKPLWALTIWRWLRGPFLGTVYTGPNNFKAIRMIAALLVMLSHAYVLTNGLEINGRDPISQVIGTRFGNITLAIFFVLSGFILASRFSLDTNALRWWLARILRIFPALILVLVVSAYVIGPLVTSLSFADYMRSEATHTYIPANASLFFLQRDLPGVFATNPHLMVVNASLWMLKYMLMCYALLFILGCLGTFDSKLWMTIFFALFAVLVLATHFRISAVSEIDLLRGWIPLLMPFVIGMMFFVWRDNIPMSPFWIVGLLVICVLMRDFRYYSYIFLFFALYTAVFIAYRLKGPLLRYNELSDFSYGTYLFGFPVQQTLIAVFGPMSTTLNMLLAVPITLGLAILCSRYVERPAMRLVR